MTTIEEDIVKWAVSRPGWQQEILRVLAAGQSLAESEIAALARNLLDGDSRAIEPLTVEDLPSTTPDKQVRLEAIREIANVNSLRDEEKLTFASTGLTVVYGDNASGKSGYARVLKAAVGARHQEPIHPNVFSDNADAPQRAVVAFDDGGAPGLYSWPGTITPALRAVRFYDEACGDDYLGGESDVTYSPPVLAMLDDLIRVCDAIQTAINKALQVNAANLIALPKVPEGTPAARFLGGLSPSTTIEEIENACEVPADAEAQLAKLAQEEVRLRATDPAKERTRLESLATASETLAKHALGLEKALSDSEIERCKKIHSESKQLRVAATVASSTAFADVPVSGVGTGTWRALWLAAKAYSEAEAYHSHEFPATTHDARCVLCQQELSAEAVGRFDRFSSFMRDTTEQQAVVAEGALGSSKASLRALETTPPRITEHLVALGDPNPELAEAVTAWLTSAGKNRDALLAYLEDEADNEATFEPQVSVVGRLEALARDLRTRAGAIDATKFQNNLIDLVAQKGDLEGRLAIGKYRDDITAEIQRRKARAVIERAKQATDTTSITRKCVELTRAHVTSTVMDRFVRESERLRLERVTLQDLGGQKGKLRHRPALLGAKRGKPVDEVLSEGEQTALGLAGYFTQAYFDSGNSALVLDDPVTSLDHARRSLVARRLAQFAKDRQVIVFTHDSSFVGDLRKHADAEQVIVTERSVERRGNVPGICVDKHPWNVKDVASRLHHLDEHIARITREKDGWDKDKYEQECAAWGGELSETWERMINVEIVYAVVDRGTSEVRPKLFRLLAKITDEDNSQFQESYARCSLWARRHDKSPETNYIAPEPDELQQELTLVRGWFERVKKYRDSKP